MLQYLIAFGAGAVIGAVGVAIYNYFSEDNEEEIEETDEEKNEKIYEMGKIEMTIPASFTTGTGYITLGQTSEINSNYRKFRENKLTPCQKAQLTKLFEPIIGMTFVDAAIYVNEKGYSLHPSYVCDDGEDTRVYREYSENSIIYSYADNDLQRVKSVYKGNVLHVNVNDCEYIRNVRDGRPSESAVITKITDIGIIEKMQT